MITTDFINCGDFGICIVHSPVAGSVIYKNTGVLSVSKYVYIIRGSGFLNDEPVFTGWHDVSSKRNMPLKVDISEEGGSWAALNHSTGEDITIQVLQEGTTQVDGADGKYITVIIGTATVNDKEVPSLKFGKLQQGKTYSVVVPTGTVAVIVNKTS